MVRESETEESERGQRAIGRVVSSDSKRQIFSHQRGSSRTREISAREGRDRDGEKKGKRRARFRARANLSVRLHIHGRRGSVVCHRCGPVQHGRGPAFRDLLRPAAPTQKNLRKKRGRREDKAGGEEAWEWR